MLSSARAFEYGGDRWWPGPGWSPDDARAAVAAALRATANGAPNLKKGPRKRLHRVDLGGDIGECLLKVNRYDQGVGRLRRLRPSKARRELSVASELLRRGVRTPAPIAAGESRDGAFLRSCTLLVPIVTGAIDLRVLWNEARESPRVRAGWAAGLGEHVRNLHAVGLDQRDLAPNNVLIAPGSSPQWLPIDFERAVVRSRLGDAARARSLAALDGHFWAASAAERMRFLVGYTHGDRDLARVWWRRLTRAAARAAARDQARLRRRMIRDGRRVETVRWREWHGWAMRDAPQLDGARARTLAPDAQAPPACAALQFTAQDDLWLGRGRGSERAARRLWSTAHLLAMRGLGPQPVALLRRDDDAIALWHAREPGAHSLSRCAHSETARTAAALLCDRLLAIGRFDAPPGPHAVALTPGANGNLRAGLLDPGAFRVSRPSRGARSARARAGVEAWFH
jgi:tRNA A-37 threonylcarbamoyl transferase component Bud32